MNTEDRLLAAWTITSIIVNVLAMLAMLWLLFLATAAQSHEWYTGLRAPDGTTCCNGADCEPVEPCWINGQPGVHIAGQCRSYKAERVLPQSSPDGQTHACYWGGEVRCVIQGGAM